MADKLLCTALKHLRMMDDAFAAAMLFYILGVFHGNNSFWLEAFAEAGSYR